MSKLEYLSKSDYKFAKSCVTKLYYKKLEYPQNPQENYTFSVANLIINKIVNLLYNDVITINQDSDYSQDKSEDNLIALIESTNQALKKENVTLSKPLIYANHKLSQLDILNKKGNRFDLIYIKQRALEPKYKNILRNKRDGRISSIWKGYLEDITYQTYILAELLGATSSDFQINSYLCLPIKNKLTSSCLGSNFLINADNKVKFLGNINELKKDHILQFINVNQEILELKEKVITKAKYFLSTITDGIKKIQAPINKNCKNCEFRIDETKSEYFFKNQKNGFNECWHQDISSDTHILDLYQVAKISYTSKDILENSIEVNNLTDNLLDVLIKDGHSSFYDIPVDSFNHPTFKSRQAIQVKYTRSNKEWIFPDLISVINCWEYPIHFIDFETCRLDIPYHSHIHPSEQIAFQWSCHTIIKPITNQLNPVENNLTDSSFIDISGEFPNFKFAETLMQQLGDRGSVLIWGTHEKSVLKDIYEQAIYYEYPNPELLTWLKNLISDSESKTSRLVDMNNLTLKYYFHPLMKGKTSLKSVLPAIWKTNNYLHQISDFATYFQLDQSGKVLSPYQTLPPIEIGDRLQVINEGSGAMIAYQKILYSPFRNDVEFSQKWGTLLKQYCDLDTLAMVIVWTHWHHLLNQASIPSSP